MADPDRSTTAPTPDSRPRPELCIGLGHPDRGDDAVGPFVVEVLRARRLPGLRCATVAGDLLRLLDLWGGVACVHVVDAMRSGASPGTVRVFDLGGTGADAPWDAAAATSTHGIGLLDVVRLGRHLGRMPAALTVHGIEAGDDALGAGLHPEVRRAALALTDRIAASCAAACDPPPDGGGT